MPSRRAYLAALATAVAGCSGPRVDTGTRTETTTRTATTTRSTTVAPSAITGSWTHIDGDAGGTRATGTDPLDAAPEEVWAADLGGTFRLAGDALYTTTERVLARRVLADGSTAWERSFDGSARLTAALDDRIYVTTGENAPTFHALSASDGSPPTARWTKDGVRGRRVDDEVVVATANDNSRLVALDPDGTERWSITPAEAERFGPVVLGSTAVFAVVERGPTTAWVAGIDRGSGEIRWSAHDPNQNTVLAATSNVVVSAGGGTAATGFSPSGDHLWEVDVGSRVEVAAIDDERVFLSQKDGGVTVVTASGDERWSRGSARVVAVDAGAAYTAGESVRALDVQTGDQRWRLDATADAVIPANGGLFTLGSGESGNVRLRLFQ